MICAVGGGTVLVIQTILLVIGGVDTTEADPDVSVDATDFQDVHDMHHTPHDASEATFLKILSFKTLVAFFTFFGLTGLACQQAEMQPLPTLLLALGAGSVALYIVAYLMSLLNRLQSRGNVNSANAVGQLGKVYLRIPGERTGSGKVNVVVQGRMLECKAITAGPEIPTGSEVRIVATAGANTLEVVPVGKE
jgi:membrane protein implicated in regulation of membrane protease activity